MKKKAVLPKSLKSPASGGLAVRDLLEVARLRAEKCELKESHATYLRALELAKKGRDLRGVMEAIAGLLRLSSEAEDRQAISRWNGELDSLMKAYPNEVPPMAWYCKGMIAFHQEKSEVARQYFHRFLRALREEKASAPKPSAKAAAKASAKGVGKSSKARESAAVTDSISPVKSAASTFDEGMAKGWLMIATTYWRTGQFARSEWLAHEVLRRWGQSGFHGIMGSTCVLLAWAAERRRDYDVALRWLQQGHGAFLADHNWYNHLWLLFSYARLARVQQNYSQAYWYLDLIDKAACGPEFGLLRSEVTRERTNLEQDAVDLLIDSRKATVRTRESGAISLGKQYVLLQILEALTAAHGREGDDLDRGLSKAEIIESVWRERYRPEAHDNKLYYNINRLRKLLEPDIRKPQYLLNWKEGYRLAPGLRVQLVVGGSQSRNSSHHQGGEAK